jgi:hypothetical protein
MDQADLEHRPSDPLIRHTERLRIVAIPAALPDGAIGPLAFL